MTPEIPIVSRFPDGLALDAGGDLYVACYESDDVHRITPPGQRRWFDDDGWAIMLSRSTNLAFHGGWLYVSNSARQTIVRAKVDVARPPLANWRGRR